MPVFNELGKLTEFLKATGQILWAGPGPGDLLPLQHDGKQYLIYLAALHPEGRAQGPGELGLYQHLSDIGITQELRLPMEKALRDEQSDLRRHSIWTIRRSFVYVDISDFSQLGSGLQRLVITALVRLVENPSEWNYEWAKECREQLEAQLCIGDGYIYVFKQAIDAAYFAAHLAALIEERIGSKAIPTFHFRIGVHVGDVRLFWDPGRNGWNYVGDGINGGQRVLAAIGKSLDDVVYISSQVRSEIQGTDVSHIREEILSYLENKGRRTDKHGEKWRVYQLNHFAVIGNLPVKG